MLKIGLIDSGIGGISILKKCLDLGINAEYIYIFDNKYHPYGGRSKSELTAITFINVERLIGIGCDIILFACNTITSACIDDIRRTFVLPIVGTEPPIKMACEHCQKVALLATPYTLNSHRVKKIIDNYPQVKMYFPDCSTLATTIEYNYNNPQALLDNLQKTMQRFTDCDGIALGCTHYCFIKDTLAQLMPNANIYDPCLGVAKQLHLKASSYIQSTSIPLIKVYATGQCLSDRQKMFILSYLSPHKVIL